MFHTTVNNHFKHTIEFKEGNLYVDEQVIETDILKLATNSFHVLHQQKSYSVEIIQIIEEDKIVVLQINGTEYTVALKDKFDLLLQQMGMSSASSKKANDLKAPMPGKVLSIAVKAGDNVNKGEPILILEAMKMENILKATADVTIKEVKVQQGDAVEKNAVLVVMG